MRLELAAAAILVTTSACASNADSGLAASSTSAMSAKASADVAAARPVFIIRHLQKGSGDDPSLTAEGAAAAKALAERLKGSGISTIFATPTRRATETAQPLADALGIQVTPYDPRNPAALVAAASRAPGAVLVVGHSNTVPDLVEKFGGTRPPPMSEADYGTLFEVDPKTGQTETFSLGAP